MAGGGKYRQIQSRLLPIISQHSSFVWLHNQFVDFNKEHKVGYVRSVEAVLNITTGDSFCHLKTKVNVCNIHLLTQRQPNCQPRKTLHRSLCPFWKQTDEIISKETDNEITAPLFLLSDLQGTTGPASIDQSAGREGGEILEQATAEERASRRVAHREDVAATLASWRRDYTTERMQWGSSQFPS